MIRLAHLLVKNVVVLHRVATPLRIELPSIPVDELHVRLMGDRQAQQFEGSKDSQAS